ncbi:Fe-S oxidoreductase, partial [Candidatus Magnetomorum sp. HK-1]
VDIIYTGEGEKTILTLLELFKCEHNPDLSNIKGIAYKNNDDIFINQPEDYILDLDKESSLPAYDLLPMDIYLSNPVVGIGRDIDFISSRGCPFECTFCYQPWGKQYRKHSVEYIKDTILYLKKKYAIDFISFQDDLFIADRNRLFEFCEIRNRFFPDLYWSCTGRANICDETLIKTIREAGCTSVSYGFESASPKILESMNKKITLDQMEKVVQLNRKYDFPIPISFILGMPGEDESSCQQTVDFCLKNNLTLDSLMFATPYPGTALFEFALNTQRIQKKDIHNFALRIGDARDFTINLTDYFTNEQLIKKYTEMKLITQKAYKPVSKHEMDKKIKSLYGNLANKYFDLSEEDKKHQRKHGASNLF